MVMLGNIWINRPKDPEDLGKGICSDCLQECDEVNVDESFDDQFGTCYQFSVGSSCCHGKLLNGRIWLDETTRPMARKEYNGGDIQPGERYEKRVVKGYYIDEDDHDKHVGIFHVERNVLIPFKCPKCGKELLLSEKYIYSIRRGAFDGKSYCRGCGDYVDNTAARNALNEIRKRRWNKSHPKRK